MLQERSRQVGREAYLGVHEKMGLHKNNGIA